MQTRDRRHEEHTDPVAPYEVRAARYRREQERTRHADRITNRKRRAR